MKLPPLFLIVSAWATGSVVLFAQEKAAVKPLEQKPAPAPAVANDPPKEVGPKAEKKPRIEVCFVLDTTGSMSGLIEGAKQKIWSIANSIVSAKPTPAVRMGLVGYRDRGDAYVTKLTALTDDIDHIYGELMGYRADGGGDTPESVSEALQVAVQDCQWSDDKDVLKIIYLVGDAPPHTDYTDGPNYKEVGKAAITKGILINTVQCGRIAGTAAYWQEMAKLADGQYVALEQTGNMRLVSTPFDDQIAELNRTMGKTLIPYGSQATQEGVRMKQSASEAASPEARGARAAFNIKSGKAVQGGDELIDSIEEGKSKLEDVKKDELPKELQSLDPAALKKHVEEKSAERKELQSKLGELVKQREAWLKDEAKKSAAKSKPDSFDDKVAEILRNQAKKKGISYETGK